MKRRIFVVMMLSIFITGCAELSTVLQTYIPDSGTITEAEVIGGLKEALVTGTRNSASILSLEDGYYGDELVKIFLPEEAEVVITNISRIPGGERLVDNVILSINRAAEDAAREVTPIFVNSITNMTVSDAFGILRGEQDAATTYLRNSTYDQLFALYKPKIEVSIGKNLIGEMSASDAWLALTTQWNSIANSIAGRIANLDPVEIELSDYLTNKALEGMFLKVEEEEIKIRNEVSARVTPLLQKVFGSLDRY